jgi:hypothetical protein
MGGFQETEEKVEDRFEWVNILKEALVDLLGT